MQTIALVTFLLGFFVTQCWSKKSLLSPDWKHCVHRLSALPNKWQDFESDNYPNGINKQTQCSWIISVSPPRRILLAFYGLNLTGSMRNCFTQYLEIYEVDTGQSLGRFCGGRRPGDYVSSGKILRVDLLADTVAGKYAGFKMKYKATKSKPGFKKTYSFVAAKLKPRKKPKPKNLSGTKTKPQPPISSGGKVNLNKRQQLRDQARQTLFSSNTSGTNQIEKRIRYNMQNRPQNLPPPPRSNPKKMSITIKSDDEEPSFNLYVIIGIVGGGIVLLIVIGVVIKLCICDKPKATQNPAPPSDNKKHFSLQSNSHPIHRLQNLPDCPPPTAHSESHHQLYINSPPTLPARNLGGYSSQRYSQPPQTIPNETSKIPNGRSSAGEMQGTLKMVDGGYVFYCPTGNGVNTIALPTSNVTLPSSTNSGDLPFDEGYGTAKNIGPRLRSSDVVKQTRKVPTLKRKFSEWEKQQIRKGTFKM